jgi:formylglycine-generating enzyme required for sulfatase activity
MNNESPSKMNFVAIAVAALILIVAGVRCFSQQAENNPNPDGSIKNGAVSSSAKAGESKGEVRVNPKDGLKYIWIPAGTFMMGCSPGDSECKDNEKPPHQVTSTKGFWLGQTEVTVGAYKRFAGATGRQMPDAPDFNGGWANDRMPIVMVSWNDAHDYCAWAGDCPAKPNGSMRRGAGAPHHVMAIWMKLHGTPTTAGGSAWTAKGF